MIYAASAASAPDSIHSEIGSSKIVWGTMADLNLIHLKFGCCGQKIMYLSAKHNATANSFKISSKRRGNFFLDLNTLLVNYDGRIKVHMVRLVHSFYEKDWIGFICKKLFVFNLSESSWADIFHEIMFRKNY